MENSCQHFIRSFSEQCETDRIWNAHPRVSSQIQGKKQSEACHSGWLLKNGEIIEGTGKEKLS